MREESIPGALSIPKGAVPVLDRGLEHTAPTYVVGSRDRCPTAIAAPHSSPPRPDLGHTGEARPKGAVRTAALARRDAVAEDVRTVFAQALVLSGANTLRRLAPAARVVSAFLPIRGEPDTRPLLLALADAGLSLALPVTPARGEPLRFLAWCPGDPLVPGRFGTVEPACGAPEREPDALFVPLAAFDRRGSRMGYGAGYYDGALRRLRALKPVVAVGIAFAAQEAETVPVEPHDERLDAVLTERGLILFGPE